MTLVEAIQRIETKYEKKVMMIEFEDGSGTKFNVRFYKDRNCTFIDLDSNRINAQPQNNSLNKPLTKFG